MPNKIYRVHFIYVVIILLLIIAFISGISFSDNDVLVDTISVTSGVVSIIIGALAIFIAIYQGLTQGTSIQKMNESADRVEATTKRLMNTNIGEIGERLISLDSSVSELTNEYRDAKEISEDFHITKDAYKTIFLHAENEYFFSTIIEKAYDIDAPFIINRTGFVILNYEKTNNQKTTIEDRRRHNSLFVRYLNMLRRSGALIYTINKEDIENKENSVTRVWVTIDFLRDEFINAIKDKKSENSKFEEISNYVKENDSLFHDKTST